MGEIGLDRGSEDGSVPFQQRGHDQSGGLAGLGGRDDHHRRARLGGDQRALVTPQDHPATLRPPHAQLAQVAAARPPRAASASAVPAATCAVHRREHGDREDDDDCQCGDQCGGHPGAPGQVGAAAGRPRRGGVAEVAR